MAVSHAMQGGHGQMRPEMRTGMHPAGFAGANDAAAAVAADAGVAVAARPSRGTGRALLLTIAGVVAIVLALTAISHINPARVPSSATAGAPLPGGDQAAATAATAGAPATATVGVPMSADQFLQQNQQR
jgi:hypothetical protein